MLGKFESGCPTKGAVRLLANYAGRNSEIISQSLRQI